MITCKEDLVNTYIENDNGVLRDVYVSLMNLHKVYICGGLTNFNYLMKKKYIGVRDFGIGVGGQGEWNNTHFINAKQLTLTDLLPTTYENTKVYSLDEDVIRKYADLCGKEYEPIIAHNGVIGVSRYADRDYMGFYSNSHTDTKQELTTITPEQILAAWDLKFNNQGLSIIEEYEKIMKRCGDINVALQGMDNAPIGIGKSIVMHALDELEKAILEPQKPKTRIEYVKVDASLSDIAKMMIDGETFYNESGDTSYAWSGYRFEVNNGGQIEIRGDFYRRIEKEVIWQEEATEFIDNAEHLGRMDGLSVVFMPITGEYSEQSEAEFIEMCHLVASLTTNPSASS